MTATLGCFISFHANWCVQKHKNGYDRRGDVEKRLRATATDLQSAFDQIKGNDCCVCGATAQNPTKATQDEILLRAELTTVTL